MMAAFSSRMISHSIIVVTVAMRSDCPTILRSMTTMSLRLSVGARLFGRLTPRSAALNPCNDSPADICLRYRSPPRELNQCREAHPSTGSWESPIL
jgi:hypothetical protein